MGQKVDYKKKNVQFSPNNREWFNFREDQVLNMIINIIKAKKMSSKGCTGYWCI